MGILHLLGAFFVMLGHHCALYGQATPVLFGCLIQSVGVKIIFLISGYLITKSLWMSNANVVNNAKVYCIKRLGRIYPELLICLIGSAFLIGPLFTSLPLEEYLSNKQTIFYIISNLRLYPTYALPGMFIENPYPGAVNGSLWTIPIEIVFYIIILFIYILCRGKKEKGKLYYSFITFGIIFAFLIGIQYYPNARIVFYGTDWIQALNVISYFFIGGIVYFYPVGKYLNTPLASILFLLFCSISFRTQVINELVCLICISYLVLSLAFDSKQVKLKWLHSEYAYGVYLWGFVIQQCIIQKFYVEFVNPWSSWSIFIVSVIVTYFVSMLSYKYIYAIVNYHLRKLYSK